MPTVKFVNEKRTIEVPEGAVLRTEAMKAGIEVYSGVRKTLHCPGIGACGTCAVRIVKGKENVSPPGAWERTRAYLGPLLFARRMSYPENELRLSCQTQVKGDIEVETHPTINLYGDKFWG